jgi:predicted DNA-binding transcriptional regulator YafY
MDIRIIIRIHECINTGNTGTPKELSQRLGISERTLYNYIAFMKHELKAPIVFNGSRRGYEYVVECGLKFYH